MPAFRPKPPFPVLNRSHPLARSLSGAWTFNGNGNQTVYDISGNNNHATLTNGPVFTPGPYGTGLSLNGSNQHGQTSKSILINNSFTVFAVVKPTSIGAFKRIAETGFSDSFYLGTGSAGTNYDFIVPTWGLSTCVGGTVTLGVTNVVAGTFLNGAGALYVDGLKVSTATAASSPNLSKTLFFGKAFNGNGNYWTGNIDLVLYYNGTLSSDEIATLTQDPFIIFRRPSSVYKIVSASAITGTGALVAGNSSLSGSGTSRSTGTGTLVDGASTLSGAGTSRSTGSGALIDSASSVSGTGTASSTGTGALVASSSSISSAGTSGSVGAGALNSGNSTIAGAGTSEVLGSGDLIVLPSSLFAIGESRSVGTGDLISPESQISGTDQEIITGTGDLVSGESSMSGTNILSPDKRYVHLCSKISYIKSHQKINRIQHYPKTSYIKLVA